MPIVFLYTPWKYKKTSGFQMFSGGIESGKKQVNLAVPL